MRQRHPALGPGSLPCRRYHEEVGPIGPDAELERHHFVPAYGMERGTRDTQVTQFLHFHDFFARVDGRRSRLRPA